MVFQGYLTSPIFTPAERWGCLQVRVRVWPSGQAGLVSPYRGPFRLSYLRVHIQRRKTRAPFKESRRKVGL